MYEPKFYYSLGANGLVMEARVDVGSQSHFWRDISKDDLSLIVEQIAAMHPECPVDADKVVWLNPASGQPYTSTVS